MCFPLSAEKTKITIYFDIQYLPFTKTDLFYVTITRICLKTLKKETKTKKSEIVHITYKNSFALRHLVVAVLK